MSRRILLILLIQDFRNIRVFMARVFGKFFIFTLLIFAGAFCGAESFRVRKVSVVSLPGDSVEERTAVLGINDSLAVFMPEDMTYLEGFELKVKIPQIVADWRDSVAFSVYDGIRPKPNVSSIDYSGSRIFVTTVPSKLNWIVQVPLKSENSMKDNGYVAKVDAVPDVSGGYTFIRFQPAMKGVPDATYEAKLEVSVKPVLIDKGTLKLKVSAPDGHAAHYQVFVDDEPVVLSGGKILLDSGKHNVNIQSEEFRNDVRTVYIEQAKTSEIKINLKSIAPTLTVTAPENSIVLIDDSKVDSFGREFAVSEGEHIVKCQIGSYEIVRSVLIEKGKSYFVNLAVDLEISEE